MKNKFLNLLEYSTFLKIMNNQAPGANYVWNTNPTDNLYTDLVFTKQIEKSMHLAETIILDLPQDNLVKKFIQENTNKHVKVTGFINKDNKLEFSIKSFFNKNLNTFYPFIPKSAGVYLFTDSLIGYQYIGSAMNFQDCVNKHLYSVRHPSSKFHKLVSENG